MGDGEVVGLLSFAEKHEREFGEAIGVVLVLRAVDKFRYLFDNPPNQCKEPSVLSIAVVELFELVILSFLSLGVHDLAMEVGETRVTVLVAISVESGQFAVVWCLVSIEVFEEESSVEDAVVGSLLEEEEGRVDVTLTADAVVASSGVLV